MNKLVLSVFSTLFFLFVIWCCILFARYGADFTKYRIDLGASFNKLNISSDWAFALSRFTTSFNTLQTKLMSADVYFADWAKNNLAMDWVWYIVLNALSYITKGIYYLYAFINFVVDIIKSAVIWFGYACWILVQLLGFVFNPVVVNNVR